MGQKSLYRGSLYIILCLKYRDNNSSWVGQEIFVSITGVWNAKNRQSSISERHVEWKKRKFCF